MNIHASTTFPKSVKCLFQNCEAATKSNTRLKNHLIFTDVCSKFRTTPYHVRKWKMEYSSKKYTVVINFTESLALRVFSFSLAGSFVLQLN